MTEKHQPLKLRKYAKPKLVERKRPQLSDLEMQVTPILTNQNDQSPTMSNTPPNSPVMDPKTPNRRSIVESFRDVYANPNLPPSYSGNVHAIANKIESYRYV